jgi:hypothetical protein
LDDLDVALYVERLFLAVLAAPEGLCHVAVLPSDLDRPFSEGYLSEVAT